MGLSENSVPLNSMVLLIIIPFLNGYFIGNINPTFSDKPISKVCSEMGRTKASQWKNQCLLYPFLIHGLPKTSHEACATAPKKSLCPPNIPRSRTLAKVPIVLLGMCTGMVRFQAQQRPCRQVMLRGAQVLGLPQIIQNYTHLVSTLKPRFWGIPPF